ncbi:MAG: PaaI family thioesterase [Actinobacteria bacterium]|nr:PaaI family thioesterase [Actinomycetota bacterium]
MSPTPDFPIATDLGLDLDTSVPGRVVAKAVAGEHHLNPNRVVHGAVVFAVVDTSMGGATMSVLEEGQFCASIEVHLRFVRALEPGAFWAETEVVHRGRRVVQLESKVFGSDDRLAATATGTFAVLEQN